MAQLENGKVEWPYYWDAKSKFDVENATVEMTGKIPNTSLSFTRRYLFLEDRVECNLTLTMATAFSLRSLSDGSPHPLPNSKPGGLRVDLLNERGVTAPDESPAKGIFFTNDTGKGHLVALSQPLPVRLTRDHSTDHYKVKQDWGRVAIQLPTTWQANQSHTLIYSVTPCIASQIKDRLLK